MLNERLKWIDGLKGIACVCVLWHHFFLAFLPRMYFGGTAAKHISVISEENLAQSPFLFFLNGNFMVALFCALSGIVVSISVFRAKCNKIGNIILKRYPRLMLPIIPIAIMVYIVIQKVPFYHMEVSTITGSAWLGGFYTDSISFGKIIYSVLIGIWLDGDTTISNAYWMLSQLFWGTFVIIVCTLVVKNINLKGSIIFLGGCTVFMLFLNNMIFIFPLSVLITYMYLHYGKLFQNKIVGIVCIIIGCFLGAYPSGIEHPTNIYRYLNFNIANINIYTFWHVIGAVILIVGVICSGDFKAVLECKVLMKLGKISYSIYLIHIPIIYFASSYIFMKFYTTNHYLKTVGIIFIVTNVIVVILADLYSRIIEKNCTHIVNYMCRIIENE